MQENESNKLTESIDVETKPDIVTRKGLAKVVGNTELKTMIWEDILVLEHGFSHTLGWILSGASGSGKTYFTDALKEDLNPEKWVCETITDQWDGEHHEVTRKIYNYFEKLKTRKKFTFLDIPECENKMMSRADSGSGKSKTSRAMTNSLLDALSHYDTPNLYILGSTNRPSYVDSAFVSNSTRFSGVYIMEAYTLDNWNNMVDMYLPGLTEHERRILASRIFEMNLMQNNFAKLWTPGDLKQINKDMEKDKIMSKITGVNRSINIVTRIQEINKRKSSINNRSDFVLSVKNKDKKQSQTKDK